MKTRTGYLFRKKGPNGKELPNWYVRVMVDGRAIVRSLGTPSRRKAEAAKVEILAPYILGGQEKVLKAVSARLDDVAEQRKVLEAAANPPPAISAIWSRFLRSKRRPDSGPSTLTQYAAEWRRFTRWLASRHPAVEELRQVTDRIAEAYSEDMDTANMTPSTFNQHLRLLRLVWRVMADDAKLTGNPWAKIQPKRLDKRGNRKRALTPAQFEALLDATEADADLHDLFLLLAWTGLRLVDGVKLHYGAVDFPNKVLTVVPQKTARRNGTEVHIPLFPAALEVLNRRLGDEAVLDPRAYVFPEVVEQYDRDRTALTKRVAAAFERAGMDPREDRPGRQRRAVAYGAHSLRHVFVTAATAAGMPAAMIKSITGHATDEMLQHYQQIGMDLAVELADRIGSAPKVLIAHGPESADKGTNAGAKAAENAGAKHKPLPAWATMRIRELANHLSSKTWITVKKELAKMGTEKSLNHDER